MQSEKQLLPKRGSNGVQSAGRVCQIPQPKGCLREGEEGSAAICPAFAVFWEGCGALQEWRCLNGLRCTLSPGTVSRYKVGAVRVEGSGRIYQGAFISQTFQGFASLLCSSGRSSGKHDQAVLHMF